MALGPVDKVRLPHTATGSSDHSLLCGRLMHSGQANRFQFDHVDFRLGFGRGNASLTCSAARDRGQITGKENQTQTLLQNSTARDMSALTIQPAKPEKRTGWAYASVKVKRLAHMRDVRSRGCEVKATTILLLITLIPAVFRGPESAAKV